jgi:hypothetical protein
MSEKETTGGAVTPLDNDGPSARLRVMRRVGKAVLFVFIWLVTLEVIGIAYCKVLRGVGYWGARQERNAFLKTLPVSRNAGEGAEIAVVINGIPREIHPYFGFTLKRDYKYVNNAGFPGSKDYPYRSATNEFVVGVFGGSVAIGQGFSSASLDVLEPGILELVAPYGFDKVTVLCLASGGWKQPQTFYSITYFLDMLDMVVVVDGFNDVNSLSLADDASYQWPLRYPGMNLYSLLASKKVSHESMLAIGRIGIMNEKLRRVTDQISHSPLRFSLSAHTLWKSWASRASLSVYEQRQIIERNSAQGGLDGSSLLAPFQDAAVAQKDDYFHFYANLSSWQAKICALQGIPYFHFIQPNQYVRDSKPYSEEERETFLSMGDTQVYKITERYERLNSIAKDLSADGVQASSLEDVFENVPETIYNDNCCHLNDFGIALVSEAMLRQISSTASNDSSGRALIGGQVVQKIRTQAGGRTQ